MGVERTQCRTTSVGERGRKGVVEGNLVQRDEREREFEASGALWPSSGYEEGWRVICDVRCRNKFPGSWKEINKSQTHKEYFQVNIS